MSAPRHNQVAPSDVPQQQQEMSASGANNEAVTSITTPAAGAAAAASSASAASKRTGPSRLPALEGNHRERISPREKSASVSATGYVTMLEQANDMRSRQGFMTPPSQPTTPTTNAQLAPIKGTGHVPSTRSPLSSPPTNITVMTQPQQQGSSPDQSQATEAGDGDVNNLNGAFKITSSVGSLHNEANMNKGSLMNGDSDSDTGDVDGNADGADGNPLVDSKPGQVLTMAPAVDEKAADNAAQQDSHDVRTSSNNSNEKDHHHHNFFASSSNNTGHAGGAVEDPSAAPIPNVCFGLLPYNWRDYTKPVLEPILKSTPWSVIINLATVLALFADDINALFFPKEADFPIQIISVVVFWLFVVEFIAVCLTDENYIFSFFFWLDMLAWVSLLPVFLYTVGVKSADPGTFALARAGRAARASTRSGRMIRLIKLMSKKKLRRAAGDDIDIMEESPSKVGEKLTQLTTIKVVTGVLLMLVVFTLLENVKTTDDVSGASLYNLELLKLEGVDEDTFDAALDLFMEHNSNVKFIRILNETLLDRDRSYLRVDVELVTITTDKNPNYDEDYKPTKTEEKALETRNIEIQQSSYERRIRSATRSRDVFYASEEAEEDDDVSDDTTTAEGQFSFMHAFLRDINSLRREKQSREQQKQQQRQSRRHNPLYNGGVRIRDLDDKIYEKKTVSPAFKYRSECKLNERTAARQQALYSILLTIFVVLLLVVGNFLFIRDSNLLVVYPIERMTNVMKKLAANPLTHLNETMSEEDMENETGILLAMLTKIAHLLQIGFGEAGAEIISNNLGANGQLNPMVPGKKIFAIFMFCDIRNFTRTTEILHEDVMVFVNTIAQIVHNVVYEFGGSPNKNIGDAFFCVWKINETSNDQKLMDAAVLAILKCRRQIEMSKPLQRLKQRLGTDVAAMGWGLHMGWAIEGSIGSNLKVDASYLSPHVNLSSRMEAATKQFGVNTIISSTCYKRLSPALQQACRRLDRVKVKGSQHPMSIYTTDHIVVHGINDIEAENYAARQLQGRLMRRFQNAGTRRPRGHRRGSASRTASSFWSRKRGSFRSTTSTGSTGNHTMASSANLPMNSSVGAIPVPPNSSAPSTPQHQNQTLDTHRSTGSQSHQGPSFVLTHNGPHAAATSDNQGNIIVSPRRESTSHPAHNLPLGSSSTSLSQVMAATTPMAADANNNADGAMGYNAHSNSHSILPGAIRPTSVTNIAPIDPEKPGFKSVEMEVMGGPTAPTQPGMDSPHLKPYSGDKDTNNSSDSDNAPGRGPRTPIKPLVDQRLAGIKESERGNPPLRRQLSLSPGGTLFMPSDPRAAGPMQRQRSPSMSVTAGVDGLQNVTLTPKAGQGQTPFQSQNQLQVPGSGVDGMTSSVGSLGGSPNGAAAAATGTGVGPSAIQGSTASLPSTASQADLHGGRELIVSIVDEDWLRLYERALDYYIGGEWTQAKELFTLCLETHPADLATTTVMEFMAETEFVPPTTWNGFRVLTEK